jgi:AAA15 family ATPase/GTPase
MLDRIQIQNYKCLRDVEVQLGDFAVLIGPNDSGKTSFLQAIRSLGIIANLPMGNAFGAD